MRKWTVWLIQQKTREGWIPLTMYVWLRRGAGVNRLLNIRESFPNEKFRLYAYVQRESRP